MLQIKSLIKFIVPLILVGIIFLMIYFLSEKYYYGLATVTSVNFLEVVSGEITSILVGINLGLNPVIAGSFIIFLESDISLFVAWNFDVLKKAPKVGRKLVDYEEKMREIIEKKRWIKTAQFLGVMTIAFIPFYGTGALPSTIIGRLLGMGWKKSWLAVTLGATIRSIIILVIIFWGYTVIT